MLGGRNGFIGGNFASGSLCEIRWTPGLIRDRFAVAFYVRGEAA
jgi:hypothetical protein